MPYRKPNREEQFEKQVKYLCAIAPKLYPNRCTMVVPHYDQRVMGRIVCSVYTRPGRETMWQLVQCGKIDTMIMFIEKEIQGRWFRKDCIAVSPDGITLPLIELAV